MKSTEFLTDGIGDTIKRGVKSVKRGLQGWGGAQDKPAEIVKRNKGYSDEFTKRLGKETEFTNRYMKPVDAKPPSPHSPAGLQQRVLDRETKKRGLGEDNNPTDTVTVDVPLLIRLMEYAKEDAETDMDLHKVAENLISLSQQGHTLSMQDYDSIIK